MQQTIQALACRLLNLDYTLLVPAAYIFCARNANICGLSVKTPFPGKEPVGIDVHSRNCISGTKAAPVAPSTGTSESGTWLVPVPGDSESCWQEYAEHHNSTDLDRLLMEEQIKVRYTP